MLIENKTLTGKIGVFKMITGEEVIARVVEETPTGVIRIKAPLSMVMIPDSDSVQGMVAFAPWMLGSDDDATIDLKANGILAMSPARADAADQYSQAVGETVDATPKNAPQEMVGRRGGRGR